MNSLLEKVVTISGEKYHMPFFHIDEAESRESMRTRFEALKENGVECIIGCPTSGEYMGWAFWYDMDIMIEELQRLDMSFFIQDEQNFPSGEANGWVRRRHPELAKKLIDMREIDAVGPLKGASFAVGSWLNPKNMRDVLRTALNSPLDGSAGVVGEMIEKAMREPIPMNELIAVVAAPKDRSKWALTGECIDLTDKVVDGWLYWDVPEGTWEIMVLFTTMKSTGRSGYINMIDRDSVHLMIDALYEPMYDRYAKHFGKTFKGFFTDEPEFGNRHGYGMCFDEDFGVGKSRMPYPWCEELKECLIKKYGPKYYLQLPALWIDSGKEQNAKVRYGYMDLITKLYEKNFVGQLGEWCTEHGCLYTGHVVEDAGNNARLGVGAGHYFRAIHGETMAGVDVVENQMLPGFDYNSHRWTLGTRDGEEFTYSLAKLGSSAAHIDPKKNGNVLCETYAAYEKVHGIKHLKWVCDNLVSRGINRMMPNYDPEVTEWNVSSGEPNPGYRGFKTLTNYLTRICSLTTGGKHSAPAAVLYHAEAEWAGDYMNCATPIHAMSLNQIDCDILPIDVYSRADEYCTKFEEHALVVNSEKYRALVIPYVEYICKEAIDFVSSLSIPVVFVQDKPAGVADGDDALLHKLDKCAVVSLEKLSDWLEANNAKDIFTEDYVPGLRYYRYQHEDMELYLFFNEYPYTEVNTNIIFPNIGKCVQYITMDNVFKSVDTCCVEDHCGNKNTKLPVCLAPGETTVFMFETRAGAFDGLDIEKKAVFSMQKEFTDGWSFSVAAPREYPNFGEVTEISEFKNLGCPDMYQVSNHNFRYIKSIVMDEIPEHVRLELGQVYDMAELYINGMKVGCRICAPYYFDIEKYLKPGMNDIVIDVVGSNRGMDSQCSMFEPLGLLGPVQLLIGEE